AQANMFKAQIIVTVTTLDISGQSFDTGSITTQDIVDACATDNGLDPAALMLVYDDNNLAFEVVRRSNGSIVCSILDLDQNGVSLQTTQTKGTVTTRQIVLQDSVSGSDSNQALPDDFAGSLNGKGVSVRDSSNGAASLTLRGKIQGSSQNNSAVYTGS